jgi:hypothetical protein
VFSMDYYSNGCMCMKEECYENVFLVMLALMDCWLL